MKYYFILFLICFSFSTVFSQTTTKKTQTSGKAKSTNPIKKEKGINWLTLEEVEEKMKEQPKKVYIDLYTDWCYWCKVMENKTFKSADVIKYMNENFYCIRFNAERADSVTFQGVKYGRIPNSKTNDLAAKWMRDRLSYPTSIFFDENFVNPQPVPGYLEVGMMETIATYLGTNKHKTMPWETYSKSYKPTWK